MILVSSCLLGIYSKYDGTITNTSSILAKYFRCGKIIPICPEQMGGLSTPRLPSEIEGGNGKDVLEGTAYVRNNAGEDVTKQYIKGAEQVQYILQNIPITAAILKERSPSCGSNKIYSGSFSKKIVDGMGVAAALLRKNNIPIYTEEEINDEIMKKLLES